MKDFWNQDILFFFCLRFLGDGFGVVSLVVDLSALLEVAGCWRWFAMDEVNLRFSRQRTYSQMVI